MGRAGPSPPALLLLLMVELTTSTPTANYALQLRSSPVVVLNTQGFDTSECTFEAWVATPVDCTLAAMLSYALNASSSDDPATRAAAYNHFVVFDATNVIACHGACSSNSVLFCIISPCLQQIFTTLTSSLIPPAAVASLPTTAAPLGR